MAKQPRIWLTRPHDDSAVLAAELAHHGIDSIVAPVMHIERCMPGAGANEKPQAILLTSRHAVHALDGLPKEWRDLPLFGVGAATAEAARAASFTTLIQGDYDVLTLLPEIAKRFAPGARVLYLAGEDTSADVHALLGSNGIAVTQATVYRATPEPSLPEELLTALRDDAVPGAVFFSARSATLAGNLLAHQRMEKTCAGMDAYCLSLAVAEKAGKLPWRTIRACHLPTRAAMVELIVSHCKQEVL